LLCLDVDDADAKEPAAKTASTTKKK